MLLSFILISSRANRMTMTSSHLVTVRIPFRHFLWWLNTAAFTTEEEGKELQAFFGGAADLSARLPQMTALADQLHEEGSKFVGTIGFCWVWI
jgi:coproporphyrinogen III oxidase